MKTYISWWWCSHCAIIFRFISDRFYPYGTLSCTECERQLYKTNVYSNAGTNKEIEVDLRHERNCRS